MDAVRWPEAAVALAGEETGGGKLPTLPAVVVWTNGRPVKRVEGGRAPTTVVGWEKAIDL
jgi:hypothetical protein